MLGSKTTFIGSWPNFGQLRVCYTYIKSRMIIAIGCYASL